MGRTLVAEEEVKTVVSGCQESQQVRTGLLLGQVTEAKDFICSAVLTPSLHELDAAEGEAKVKEDGFEDWWVVEHAAQVYGLLPGGINIVGVFICCPTPSLPPLQARISKILTDIASKQEFKGHQPHQHSSLLHYCSTKKKFKCQTINLGDAQAGFRPAELKFKAHVSQWCKVEATVSLDSECVLPAPPPHPREEEEEEKGRGKSKSQVELAQVREGLSEVLEGLQGAVVTLRGQLVQNASSPLLQHNTKKSKQLSASSETIQAALYLRKSGRQAGPPVAVPEGSRRAHLKGKMALLAYLQPKATAAEAIAAVQQDACRSLVARLQAAVEAQDETFPEQLPIRVALTTSTSLLPFTEYSLPHEDTQECVSRAGELLGANAETVVVTPLEQFSASGREDHLTSSPILSQESEKQDMSGTALKRYYGIASVLASISIVLISISVWIILQ